MYSVSNGSTCTSYAASSLGFNHSATFQKIKAGGDRYGGFPTFDESVSSLSSSIVCYSDLIPFKCKRAREGEDI